MRMNIQVKNGMTQSAFSYEQAIVEEVYVETMIDSDEDGKNDRIYVEVIRPQETVEGYKVPVIYNMSPYNGGLDYPEYFDVDEELYGGAPTYTKEGHYDKYFVERGYAVVNANSIGSKGSDGCPTTGDKYEILAAKAVVDWLNHRAQAFNSKGEQVIANWTTGSVGMIGLSYEGTIANGVATTGVDGLKTIVPIGSISNWYDYYRANGAVIAPGGYQGDDADRLARGVLTRENPDICHCLIDKIEEDQDRITGNYNDFWDARNYINDAKNIKASVLVVHGLNDMNVKRKQFAEWWEVLKQYDVPRKLWLHQGGHIDPKKADEDKWLTTINKWFDYWLYDIDNGIMDEPKVDIEKIDHTWEQLQEWPHQDVETKQLFLRKGQDGIGGLSLYSQEDYDVSFVDAPLKQTTELIKSPSTSSSHRVAFLSPILQESIRLSGTPHLTIHASFDHTAANLSALLVDYGPDGETIVTRGWMDPRNGESLRESRPLVPHQSYELTWPLEPHDYTFAAGHRLGLVILSTDYEYTKRPKTIVSVTVSLKDSYLTLPLVGMFPK